MVSENGNSMVMPVAPAYANGGGVGFGNDWGWIILLLLFANGGMWGGFGGGMWGMEGLYPWMNNSQNINNGFRDQMINDNINSIRDGVQGISTQLCNGFAGVNSTVSNGFAQAEISNNARQMADMQQMFGLSQQLSQCCCDNRLATANLSSDIAREACATRTSDTQNTQLILNAINDGFRAMSDQRFQDKIDAKNDEIAQLRQENLYARGQASQIQQNATIVNDIYNRLNQCPVGTVPVYGEQSIFTCPNNNNGCGCGCNGTF